MDASLYHLQINTSEPEFYKRLLKYLEYRIIDEWEDGFGANDGNVDLWVFKTEQKHASREYHRKAAGLNHLAFKVSSKEDVDRFTKEFLKSESITPLYESPKEFPEYSENYYAVYFEDPDRIKLEVVSK